MNILVGVLCAVCVAAAVFGWGVDNGKSTVDKEKDDAKNTENEPEEADD